MNQPDLFYPGPEVGLDALPADIFDGDSFVVTDNEVHVTLAYKDNDTQAVEMMTTAGCQKSVLWAVHCFAARYGAEDSDVFIQIHEFR